MKGKIQGDQHGREGGEGASQGGDPRRAGQRGQHVQRSWGRGAGPGGRSRLGEGESGRKWSPAGCRVQGHVGLAIKTLYIYFFT